MAVIKEMIRQVETDHKGKLEQITNMQQEHKYVLGPALWVGLYLRIDWVTLHQYKFLFGPYGQVMTLLCNNMRQNIVETI